MKRSNVYLIALLFAIGAMVFLFRPRPSPPSLEDRLESVVAPGSLDRFTEHAGRIEIAWTMAPILSESTAPFEARREIAEILKTVCESRDDFDLIYLSASHPLEGGEKSKVVIELTYTKFAIWRTSGWDGILESVFNLASSKQVDPVFDP